MAEQARRYFWLKLQATYFNQLEQKKMRRQEHGKDMQIVYLRMMLLSIDKGGYIYYQGVYDSLEEELAEEFDEPVDVVKETLEYLKENGMISINEKSDCFIPESLKLIGSECYSAERVRRFRKNQKTLQCNTDVTMGNGCVMPRNEEKEIELEKEIDNKNTNSASDNAPKASRQEVNDFFESVWKLYPNKKGKGQVSDSKKKALYNIGFEEISRAIGRYKEGLEAEEWRKPQNGSTFFNSGYIDYLDENYRAGQQPQEGYDISEEDKWYKEYARRFLPDDYEPSPDDPFQ